MTGEFIRKGHEMTHEKAFKISRALKNLTLLAALAYIFIYLTLAALRIFYPYELEWMEGGAVDHITRILSGLALYEKPSIEFMSFPYTPLYFYVSALICKFSWTGFAQLRLVSFASSIACMFFIYKFVRMETGNKTASLIAAGFFAATFGQTGFWMDIAREDTMFLAFFLAAAYIIRFHETASYYILAGALIALSFLSKQTALMMSAPLMLYTLISNKRLAFYFISSTAFFLGGSILLFDKIYDGWFSFHVFSVLFYLHQFSRQVNDVFMNLFNFIAGDVSLMAPALCVCLLFFFEAFKKDRSAFWFYSLMFAGMFAGPAYTRILWESYINVLIPACAIVAVITGLFIAGMSRNAITDEPGRLKYSNIIFFICITQFALLAYDPVRQVPSAADKKAGDALIELIRNIKGEVFMPYHGFLCSLAGKSTHIHMLPMINILLSSNEKMKNEFLSEMNAFMKKKRFAAIILDTNTLLKKNTGIADNYVFKKFIFNDTKTFWPVAGAETRPKYLMVPK